MERRWCDTTIVTQVGVIELEDARGLHLGDVDDDFESAAAALTVEAESFTSWDLLRLKLAAIFRYEGSKRQLELVHFRKAERQS